MTTTVSSKIPVTTAFNAQAQIPMGGFRSETVHRIFMQCLSNGDLKGFKALSVTNVHSCVTMRKLLTETALTQLCPNLRILDAKTFTFHEDLATVNKYKTVQSYYKLEPFVERREGLTIIFNQGGLTLKDMKENKCGVKVKVLWDLISTQLDNVPEKEGRPEMVSNAPLTETRNKGYKVQETRVRDGVGFDGKPTLIQKLALLIATQKHLKICLYGEDPITYGSTSTELLGSALVAGGSTLGYVYIRGSSSWGDEIKGAGGRLKL